jgi:hypothetical protein
MYRILRAVLFALFVIILASPLLSGCTAPCNYPDQRGAGGVSIRILNAMPDMVMITVFINGKQVVQDYTYDPPPGFGYRTTYYKDGTPLSAGDSELFVVTSDAAGKDTLITQRLSINFDRQTVIVMGRGHPKFPQKKTALIVRLDDQIDQTDPTQTLIRFVNAVPDLDSLDVYFKGDTVGKSLGKPDLTIHYGEVTRHIILNSVTGLTITEAGHPNNVIFTVGYPFGVPGFFITVVIRGESKPLGTDFTAAPIVLSDAAIGNYILNFKTFAVRLVNASRTSNLSLWIRSTTVFPEATNKPRGSNLGVANYPSQEKVLGINPGITTDYIPLNITLNSITNFWFAKDSSIMDTIMFTDTAQSDLRYSKIAIEENIIGSSGKKLSHLTLPDTMTNPSNNLGRVRVLHLSPDHQFIDVTLNGKKVTMNFKEVQFFDAPANSQITLKAGVTSMTYTIPVSPTRPISVYILPDQSAATLPITTSND